MFFLRVHHFQCFPLPKKRKYSRIPNRGTALTDCDQSPKEGHFIKSRTVPTSETYRDEQKIWAMAVSDIVVTYLALYDNNIVLMLKIL
jgi:hypothetical protein